MDGSQETPPRAANPHVSDAELLTRRFTVDDPEALDGLVMAVPKTTETPAIEYWYDVTPPRRHGRPAGPKDRPFVRCVHCKAPRHWKGFVMRTAAGERFLVGKDCGAEIYGAHFEVIARDFEGQRARQGQLRRLARVHQALPAALRAAGELARSPALGRFEDLRGRLRDAMPDHFRHLAFAAGSLAGELRVIEKVRDYRAEEARAEEEREEAADIAKLTVTRRKTLRKAGQIPKPDKRPLFRTVETSLGRLAGRAFADPATDPRCRLQIAHDALKATFHRLEGTRSEDLTASALQAAFRALRDAFDGVAAAHAALVAAARFFEPANVALLAEWAERRDGNHGRYAVEGGALVRRDGSLDDIVVALPGDFAIPDVAALDALREALG